MATVVGLFDRVDQAQAAVQDLTQREVAREDISVVTSDARGEATQAVGDTSSAGAGAATGAVGGGILGGALGVLVGLGALAIPGIGPVLAAGPLVAALGSAGAGALVGAGAGAVGGGLLGALVGAGVPEQQAHYYAEGVRRGGTLVTVQTDDGLEPTVRDILHTHAAVDIDARGAEWRSNGWDGFRGDDVASTTEIPEHRAHDAPDDRTGIPADTTVATSVGALTSGAIPGGYGPAGATLFGDDDPARDDRRKRD